MPGQFDELRKKLEAQLTFPSIYMFKFILKSDNRKMALIENIFEEDADIIQNQSEKGNFTSITVKQIVMSVDEIIDVYERAAQIEGVMSL